MIRSLLRFVIRLAIVAGVVAIVLRLLRQGQGASPARREPTGTRRPTSPSSSPAPAEAPARPSAPEVAAWVAPDFDGNCPDTHPVKVKQSSGIYHVPGGLSYDRTTPDRCYSEVAAAAADGYRPSKR